MTRNDYLNLYWKWGWTILPVLKGTKRPAVNWKNYQEKKPSRQELLEWFKDPSTGVGIVTGKASGVIVVDEDSYKKNGIELALETPLQVQSGSGGKHYYFKYKEGITNSVNRENAIDVRGEGGFVVLPSTLHPNGKPYKWIGELPSNLDNLPTLDEAFADQFIKNQGATEPLKISDFMNIGEGARDDSLHRVACSIINKVSDQEAWQLVEAVNQTYDPPLPGRDVERIFKQAVKFVRNNPLEEFKEKKKQEIEEQENQPLEILSFEEATKSYEDLSAKFGEGLTTGYDVLDEYFKFIPTHLYLFSASTHVGKTTIALNIAGRIAKTGTKVVMASLEQGVFVIPRLRSMFPGVDLSPLSFIAPDELPTVKSFVNTFKDDSKKPKLLIVDHLHFFQRKGRGATEDIDALITELQMLARKLEIPVLLLCHLRKLNERKQPNMDDLKDSVALSQVPSVVCLMHRDREETEDKSGNGMLLPTGKLFIVKNRVFGKSGTEEFMLGDDGRIEFSKMVYKPQPTMDFVRSVVDD